MLRLLMTIAVALAAYYVARFLRVRCFPAPLYAARTTLRHVCAVKTAEP